MKLHGRWMKIKYKMGRVAWGRVQEICLEGINSRPIHMPGRLRYNASYWYNMEPQSINRQIDIKTYKKGHYKNRYYPHKHIKIDIIHQHILSTLVRMKHKIGFELLCWVLLRLESASI